MHGLKLRTYSIYKAAVKENKLKAKMNKKKILIFWSDIYFKNL
tara:strand:- start:2053 stop:2181 length:129 start_codon:yes stop_codon:yes gene_type:complete